MSLWTKFCIGYCAVMWIVFGGFHFVFHGVAMDQMPAFFTNKTLASYLVYMSGFMEIVAGFGLLLKSTRRWAALLSIVTLILIFPATIYVTFWPEATAQFQDPVKTVFRIINIPNAVLMLVCSVYLWRRK